MKKKILSLTAAGLACLVAQSASAEHNHHHHGNNNGHSYSNSSSKYSHSNGHSYGKNHGDSCHSHSYNSCFSNCGWYVGASGSIAWHRDVDACVDTTTETGKNLSIDLKTGWGLNAAIGYYMDCWSVDIEGLYRTYDLDSGCIGDTALTGLSGRYQDWAVLANLNYELCVEEPFSIFLSGGLGVGFPCIDICANEFANLKDNNNSKKIDDHDTVFAYQFKAGVLFSLDNCFNLCGCGTWDLFANYRFFATTKPTFDCVKIDHPYSHSVDVGLRWKF